MTAKQNADYLLDAAMKAGITDPKELGNFMGQMHVECGGYGRMSENLNYSGERLLEVFPGRNGMDTPAEANRVAAGGPEAIANAVYGGAWGKKNLGNTEPGDGWTFHGRGYVQLTGRDNYERVGKELGLDLVRHPELAEDKAIAARIAVHYWKDRVVPNHDQNDVKKACFDINGGYNGLPERRKAAESWEKALQNGYKPNGPEALPTQAHSVSRQHLSKDKVIHVQELLRDQGYVDSKGKPLDPDGAMGKETKAAIEKFQTDHKLKPDGIVGPATLKALESGRESRHDAPHATNGPLLDDAAHPGHSMFRQALGELQKLDVAHGRPSGEHTERVAGSLTASATAAGLDRIDTVGLSHDATRVYAVQGQEHSPFKKVADVDVMQAVQTPLEQSSAQAHASSQSHAQTAAALASSQQLAETQAQQQNTRHV